MTNDTEMADALVWETPPEPPPSRVDSVAAQLRARPGEWAMIADERSLQLLPWWAPLGRDLEFEVKIVPTERRAFGPRKVYARWVDLKD